MVAVLPVEIEISSLCVLMEAGIGEAELVQAIYDQLNLLNKKMLKDLCYGQCYQRRMARSYIRKTKNFREGDMVLKKLQHLRMMHETNNLVRVLIW